jgi:hypothetical protein
VELEIEVAGFASNVWASVLLLGKNDIHSHYIYANARRDRWMSMRAFGKGIPGQQFRIEYKRWIAMHNSLCAGIWLLRQSDQGHGETLLNLFDEGSFDHLS